MGFREDAESGKLDHLLVQPKADTVALDDPFLRAEARALVEAVHGGRMDPAALFDFREAILTGPGAGGQVFGTPGTDPVAVIAAEDAGWVRVGSQSGAATDAFYLGNRDQMVRFLFWLYGHNPFARNAVDVYTTFTIGEGFRVVWGTHEAQDRWDALAEEVEWEMRLRQTIHHTYLLGEYFPLVLPLTARVTRQDGKIIAAQDFERNPDRPRLLRGLTPEQVARIITRGDPEFDSGSTADADTVIGYLRNDGQTILGAADVIHTRYERIGNLTRGMSILYPVLKYLRFSEKWFENRHWLNFVRARIPAIRKVAGGSARVDAEKVRSQTLPPPGSVVFENMATDWKFPEMNLEADDARHDGRAILLAISAGLGLPEFVLTADASNANYSGAFAAESPMVKKFETLQAVWLPQIRRIIVALTGSDDFEVSAGEIIRRNLKQLVEPYVLLLDRGVVSRQTVATKAGLDWTVEERQIEADRAAGAGFSTDAGDHEPGDMGDHDDEPMMPGAKGGRPPREGTPGDDGRGNRRPRPTET